MYKAFQQHKKLEPQSNELFVYVKHLPGNKSSNMSIAVCFPIYIHNLVLKQVLPEKYQ